MRKVVIILVYFENQKIVFYLTVKQVEFCLLVEVSVSLMQSILIYSHKKREKHYFWFSKICNHVYPKRKKYNRCYENQKYSSTY